MNTTDFTSPWPYEHRFELTVRGSLLAVVPTVWKTAIELMSSEIISQGKTPYCHYYLLSCGFLVVFDHRAVLVSTTEGGLMDAGSYLLSALEEKIPTHATLTRRYPIGEDLLSLAVHELDESILPPAIAKLESGTIHAWPLQSESPAQLPQTLTLLMHGLAASATPAELRAAINETSPEFLVVTNQTSSDGTSVVAVGNQQYIAVQSTELTYASIEISVHEWFGVEDLISRLLMLYRPEMVAPIWHGEPLEHHFGNSCNNDVVPPIKS
jgi:hypothetical protein